MKRLSINRMALVFDTDRGSIVKWMSRGMPVARWPQGTKPAELSFPAVLRWRRDELLTYWEPEEVEQMTAQIKARYRDLTKVWR